MVSRVWRRNDSTEPGSTQPVSPKGMAWCSIRMTFGEEGLRIPQTSDPRNMTQEVGVLDSTGMTNDICHGIEEVAEGSGTGVHP